MLVPAALKLIIALWLIVILTMFFILVAITVFINIDHLCISRLFMPLFSCCVLHASI